MFRDGQCISGGRRLIDPEVPFNPYNTMVHGIETSDVANSPTFPEVWRELGPLLEGQTVVAHNLGFDLGVLRTTAARYGVRGTSFDALCTYRLAKATWPGLDSYSLGWLAMHLGLDAFEHHEAGDDALAAGLIAGRICDDLGCKIIDAAEHFQFVPAHISPESYVGFHSATSAKKLTSSDGNAAANSDHPLYGSTVCFTGGLVSMPRREASEAICSVGANFKTNVSAKVDYLVLGDADFVSFADGWCTEKLAKARTLIEKGVSLEIIPEREFLALLRG